MAGSNAEVGTGEQVRAVRIAAGLFALESRGLVEVSGSEAERWLDGMVSNDVASLAPGEQRSGCFAAVLTPKGRVVADVHVLLRPAGYWLETALEATPALIERLSKYVIADDVALADRSAAFDRLSLEGPASGRILSLAAGRPASLSPDACVDLALGGVDVTVAAFGWSGELAFQILAPAGRGSEVAGALLEVGSPEGLVEAGGRALEILRIEAGIPGLGSELDEEVLPDEARLERAISTTKGCYTGQEIVARLRSRGRVNHLLVGLEFDGALPELDAELAAEGRRVGEVTSVCLSPRAGAIGLGYVRRSHAESGTTLLVSSASAGSLSAGSVSVGSLSARVTALPFAAADVSGWPPTEQARGE